MGDISFWRISLFFFFFKNEHSYVLIFFTPVRSWSQAHLPLCPDTGLAHTCRTNLVLPPFVCHNSANNITNGSIGHKVIERWPACHLSGEITTCD